MLPNCIRIKTTDFFAKEKERQREERDRDREGEKERERRRERERACHVCGLILVLYDKLILLTVS